MIFVGIIWGGAVQFKNEMDEVFYKYSKPLYSIELDLGNFYNDFVYDIYQEEDTPKWKIHEKVKHMQNVDKKVRVVFFDISTDKQYYHERKRNMVFYNVETMKGEVRNKFKDKVDDYFFDIIFHLTDNTKELRYTADILKKYIALIQKRDSVNHGYNGDMVDMFSNFDTPSLIPGKHLEEQELQA